MGNAKPHVPVKLFAAITYASTVERDNLLTGIAGLLAKIEFKSEVFNFSQFTDYYQDEMGLDLFKQIVVFAGTIAPEALPGIKLSTNEFEQKNLRHGNRLVNIDPGYVTSAKVLLATTKDYSHRIYLGQGIYGDVHLCYKQQAFQIQPWTYPDYRQPQILDFFNQVRNEYLRQLKLTLD
jgi:Domain of unknown function (DUF4416)